MIKSSRSDKIYVLTEAVWRFLQHTIFLGESSGGFLAAVSERSYLCSESESQKMPARGGGGGRFCCSLSFYCLPDEMRSALWEDDITEKSSHDYDSRISPPTLLLQTQHGLISKVLPKQRKYLQAGAKVNGGGGANTPQTWREGGAWESWTGSDGALELF